MPAQIPCLWFDGQAEQAAQFYTEVFPNSTIDEVTRFGPDTPGTEGSVMTVDFTLDGTRFLGLNGGPQFTFNEAVSFQIICADQAEVDCYWDALTASGGEEARAAGSRTGSGCPGRSCRPGSTSSCGSRSRARPPRDAGDAQDGQARHRRHGARRGRRALLTLPRGSTSPGADENGDFGHIRPTIAMFVRASTRREPAAGRRNEREIEHGTQAREGPRRIRSDGASSRNVRIQATSGLPS